MALHIYVDAYSGYKANERPRLFVLYQEAYKIAAVVDQWHEPWATYFKIRTTEGKIYILRYDEQSEEWTLQSGFDGDELLGRPGIEVVPVDGGVIRQAEKRIEACEHCHEDDADIPDSRIETIYKDE